MGFRSCSGRCAPSRHLTESHPQVLIIARALVRTSPGAGRSPRSTKLDILIEYDAATPAERGVLLRREGLYSSHLSEWRKARDNGALGGLSPAPRSGTTSAQDKENAKLKARAERAERELAKTQAALEIMGKAHALLELLSESAGTEPRSKP